LALISYGWYPFLMADNQISLLLQEGAAQLGVSLSTEQVRCFVDYLRELNQWRKRINLSSRKDDREIIIKDFLDSLTIVKYLPLNTSFMDLGSGAGFPGIPLKIVRPDLKLLLLEATRKKVFFLKDVQRGLGLGGIEIRWTGEDRGVEDLSGIFDFVASRAFGFLLKFAEEGIPYLKKGGVLLAMKGKRGREELEESRSSLEKMGLKLFFQEEIQLPYLNHKRFIIGLKMD
jgi:16S rRNA (guanine527-N7)-methyltransferase